MAVNVMSLRTVVIVVSLATTRGFSSSIFPNKTVPNVLHRTNNSLYGWFVHPDKCATDICGLPNLSHKIIGGQVTLKNEFPWMVGLHDTATYLLTGAKVSHFCGGALISKSWVITAAHCTEGLQHNPWKLLISVSRHDLSRWQIFDAGFVAPRVARKIIIHPKYNVKTSNFDLSLIKLLWPVPWTPTIRPICFPNTDPDLDGQNGLVIGWGALSEGGAMSSVLMEVTVPLLTNEECQKLYQNDRIVITPQMLCASPSGGGKDSCQGDSGGPMMLQCGDRYLLIGVVSFGIGCGEAKHPGVYARVTQFREWIYSEIDKTEVCINNNPCDPNKVK